MRVFTVRRRTGIWGDPVARGDAMSSRIVRAVFSLGLVVPSVLILTGPPAAAATITPSRDAATVTAALADPLAGGVLTGSQFPIIPPAAGGAECSNGVDDDGDGFIDYAPPGGDPDCISAADDVELADSPAECANGVDDDGDG